MKILFTGGGTGGHIFPIISIIREIRKTFPRELVLNISFVGPKDQFSEIFFSQEGVQVKNILSGKIRRYFTLISFFKNLVDVVFKIPLGILQSFFYIFFWAPDLIFSKGGYGSIPVVLSGWLLRVPIILHESDAMPGLTNRFLSRFAAAVFVSFPNTSYFPAKKTVLVGNPIRKEILNGSREKGKAIFKLSGEKPIIFIAGGSQGAQRINDKILDILPELLKNFELLHQTGEKNFETVVAESKIMISKEMARYYHPVPFLDEEEMREAYAVSELIISRAGASTIFEIAAVGKPSILIPLPEAAQDHQLNNAYIYAQKGAAVVLEEENFTPRFFLERLKYLFSHPQILEKMSQASKEFAKPIADQVIAKYILTYCTRTAKE